jgi:transposase
METRVKAYTKTYVARAVRLCDESNRPISEVARDLGVEYATLYGWMKKAGRTRKRLDAATPAVPAPVAPQTDAVTRAELEQLRRELEEVKKERDFLKKAAAFFAQQNK